MVVEQHKAIAIFALSPLFNKYCVHDINANATHMVRVFVTNAISVICLQLSLKQTNFAMTSRPTICVESTKGFKFHRTNNIHYIIYL